MAWLLRRNWPLHGMVTTRENLYLDYNFVLLNLPTEEP